ncbi:hypothetical protein [Sphingomonas xinjiangensis]|uniref:Uncharacterized protein n=1 Tax=Sphingomonas xinjiangensis TaxID=643568 RepID=A0A840YRT5_9SPHN|nr:hypothetical protein [Sphingomonas xinjiangensis]MBB5712386.1 hypothetical protein [Sphingomonas xinjiangensis]
MYFLMMIPAVLGLGGVPAQATKTFNVAGQKLEGKDKTVCTIRGTWSDGEPFMYVAWDKCSEMRVERGETKPTQETIEQVHGTEQTFVVPAGADRLLISNDYSRVLVFRAASGEPEEILISD